MSTTNYTFQSDMLTVEAIQRRLEDMSLASVAKKTSLHRHTLRDICSGKRKPSYETLKTLSDYFEARELGDSEVVKQ